MRDGPDETRSDEQLMAAHADGDSAAFESLFRRRAPELLRLVRRHIPEEDVARDVVQQAFVQLHTARHDFRTDARLRPWLNTIALNLVRQHYRRRKVRKEGPMSEGLGIAEELRPSRLEREQDASRLREALGLLPDGQREVVVLHWFEEKSFAEVAELVDSSEGAVRVRAHRAYKRLRELLDSTD